MRKVEGKELQYKEGVGNSGAGSLPSHDLDVHLGGRMPIEEGQKSREGISKSGC